MTADGNKTMRRAGQILCAIFSAWYLWALAWQPQPMLWWVAFPVSLLLAMITILVPRSMYVWLPASIMLFNGALPSLPWPQVKFALLGPALAIALSAFRPVRAQEDEEYPPRITTAFATLFACLAIATVLGILNRFVLKEPAAWSELWYRIRTIPFIDERDSYVGLRLLWTWSLALGLYLSLRRCLREKGSGLLLVWSITITTIPIALFGIYSYVTRKYMVGQYAYEHRINATFSSPAVLADTFTASLLLAFHLWRLCSRTWERMVLRVAMVLQITTVLLSGCRINLVVLGIFGGIWAWLRLARATSVSRRKLALATVLAAMIAASIVIGGWIVMPAAAKTAVQKMPGIGRFVLFIPVPTLSVQENIQRIMPGRWRHWQAAMNMAETSPLWGVGVGMFEQQYVKYRMPDDLFWYAQAHNAYIRVFAEGGLVTFCALAVFLVVVARRILRCYHDSRLALGHECDIMARGFSVALAGIVIMALTSDVWYGNIESLMFLAMIAACLGCACEQMEIEYETDEEPGYPGDSPIAHVREFASHMLMTLTWGRAQEVRVRWIIVGTALMVLALIGVRDTRRACGRAMNENMLAFGWYARAPIPGEWSAMGLHAALRATIRHPVLTFMYRALSDRAAQKNDELKLFVNESLTATLKLNTTRPTQFYCDVTALTGEVAFVRFEANHAYVPWKEHWFEDPKSYGAVMTPVTWLDDAPTALVRRVTGVWNNHWAGEPEAYAAAGYPLSNRTFRVRAQ